MFPRQMQPYGLPFRRWLTSTGDGLTGDFNLIGNYSASPTDFYYIAPYRYFVKSVIISISDDAGFNQSDYGAIPGGLTNGVGFFVRPANSLVDTRLIHTVNIKKNYEWLAIVERVQLTQFKGLPQTISIVLDVVDEFGIYFPLNPGDRFIVRLNDDFTGLIAHTFGLRGIDMRAIQ
jgi:hypothetical protein